MNLTEIGFDILNLSSCTVRKKNMLLSLILFLIALCILPVVIVFTILYITKTPVEINNVLTYYGDPAYTAFFSVFLPAFWGVTMFIFCLGMLSLLIKPKLYIIMGKDSRNFDTFYYIYNYRKNEEIYLTEKYAIIHNTKYNKTRQEYKYEEIKYLFNKYLFWHNIQNSENGKIKDKKNKTVVIIKDYYKGNHRMYYLKRYAFKSDFQIMPAIITETLGYARAGGTNYQSMNRYYIDDINRSQPIKIHLEIKNVLNGLT